MLKRINYNYIKNKVINKKFFWWLFLFLFMLIFHARHYMNSDEGVILEGAWNLINGRELYFGFFEFVTPGSFYAVFWIWKIFGVHYFAAKLIGLTAVFLGAIGIYKISRLVSKSVLSYLMPVIFIASSFGWPIINHNTFSLPFIIWGVYFFLKAINSFSRKDCVISGVLLGISALFLQHKGIFIIFILFLYLVLMRLIKNNKIFLKLIPCLLAPSVLFVCLLIIKWPAKLLYENLIAFPLFHYMETNKVSYYLFAFFLLFFVCMAWELKKNPAKAVKPLIFIQFFLLLSTLQRPDFYHINLMLFPTYCLMPLFLQDIKTKKFCKFYYGAAVLAVFLMIIPSIFSLAFFSPFYSARGNEIFDFISKNCPGKYIYAGPFIPNFYFETKKLNPTPYSILITNHQTKEQFIEAKQHLEKNNPSCAVLNYWMVEKFNHSKNNPVDEYILENYQPAFDSGGAVVYKK